MKDQPHIQNVPAPNPASPAATSNPKARRSPFVSVVSVTLNCREDALLTAKSVWAQEGVDYQYIVKDGMSVDGTPEAIRRAGPAEIRVAPDTGIYDAMNQALSYCTGNYVLFLNAGDRLLEPNSLRRIHAFAEEHSVPGIVYTHYRNELLEYEGRAPAKLTRFYLYRRPLCHQATYITRDCYERYGGFDLSFPGVADHELLTRLVCRHAIRAELCPYVTVVYKDGGYTANPKNAVLANQERRRLRLRHYSSRERLLFGAILLFTLHGLRQRLFKPNEKGVLGRVYQRLANRCLGAGPVPRKPLEG
jgi:glycosyltransferase involved in cell wall biosynthesis